MPDFVPDMSLQLSMFLLHDTFHGRACHCNFGSLCCVSQEDLERSQRLRQAQQEFEIDDDMIGGQQGNSLLELIKQGKLQKKAPAKREERAAAAAAAAAAVATAAAAASRPVSAGPATSEV